MNQPNLYNEHELLIQVSEGNESAFRELFTQYRRRLFSYLFRITGSPEISEDLLQEVFIDLWSIRQRLPSIENLNAYLHRMAHNQASKGLRLVARELLVRDRIREEETGNEDPGSRLLTEEAKVIIQALVDQLSPAQKRVFLLSREHNLDPKEIAEQLNLTPNTVRKHLRDAVSFLREELGKRYGTGAIALYVVLNLGMP